MMFGFNPKHQQYRDTNITNYFSDVILVLSGKGSLTAPSMLRPGYLQWVLSRYGGGDWEELERTHRKAIWKDSSDMGHYFERCPSHQIAKKPIFLYFSAQITPPWKTPDL